MWQGLLSWTLCLGRGKASRIVTTFTMCCMPLPSLHAFIYLFLPLSHLFQGGPSTINEMCLVFFFYYPRINISSCLGYPDIIYVTNELGEEASEWVILESETHKCGKGYWKDLGKGQKKCHSFPPSWWARSPRGWPNHSLQSSLLLLPVFAQKALTTGVLSESFCISKGTVKRSRWQLTLESQIPYAQISLSCCTWTLVYSHVQTFK